MVVGLDEGDGGQESGARELIAMSETNAHWERARFRVSLRGLLVLIVLASVIALPVRFVIDARRAARTTASFGAMNYIRHALENYRTVNGHYPPPYSVDANAKPLLSWRVHLLPFLGYEHVYAKFDLSKPWDSQTNKPLIAEMPEVLALLDAESMRLAHTAVCGVTGDETLFRLQPPVTSDDITDSENTIALVEVTGSGIPWTEPRDLKFDNMSFELNDAEKPSLRSPSWRRPIVISVGRECRELPAQISREELRAMLTISAGD